MCFHVTLCLAQNHIMETTSPPKGSDVVFLYVVSFFASESLAERTGFSMPGFKHDSIRDGHSVAMFRFGWALPPNNAAATFTYDLNGQRFIRNGNGYRLNLLGPHQMHNAEVVLETVEALLDRGWDISEASVSAGLRDVKWPARMEILSRSPLFILDGGHNPQCAEALVDSAKELLPGKKVVFLTGVLADKDYPTITELMMPLAQAFVCLTPLSDRALPAEELAAYLSSHGASAVVCADVAKGIRAALACAGKDGAVIAFGSLYLAGAIRGTFRRCHYGSADTRLTSH